MTILTTHVLPEVTKAPLSELFSLGISFVFIADLNQISYFRFLNDSVIDLYFIFITNHPQITFIVAVIIAHWRCKVADRKNAFKNQPSVARSAVLSEMKTSNNFTFIVI